MITSPNFESDTSFQSSEDTMSEDNNMYRTAESHGDWGIVSNNGSDASSSNLDSFGANGYYGSGVLILDGVDSEDTRSGFEGLSIPGTDSLPTDIGTLSEGNRMIFFEDDESFGSSLGRKRKRNFFVLFLAFLSMCLGGLYFLVRERNSMRMSVSKQEMELNRLRQEIQRLELEKDDLESKFTAQPEWDAGHDDESDYLTIFDTCWLTAKVKVGECGKKVGEAPKNLADLLFGATNGAFHEDFGSEKKGLDHDSTGSSHDSGNQDLFESLLSFPDVFGDTIASATKAVASKVALMKGALHEYGGPATPDLESSITQATEVIAEVVTAASEAVASELKDLSDDPLQYILATVKKSESASKPERVTRKGLEEISVRMAAIMDDPLSYFEYRSETKNA